LVALGPGEAFETAAPERGITLRIRCAWENTTQGLLTKPITELVRLSVDGRAAAPQLVVIKQPGRDVLVDHFHVHAMPDLPPGRHTATAVVRVIGKGVERESTIQFGG
jgi:hypothetical protein